MMANQGNLPGEDYQSQPGYLRRDDGSLMPVGQHLPPPVVDSWARIPHRYLVTYPGQPETEVDVAGWQAAERAAGFSAPEGRNATAGFTGHGIEGRISFSPVQEEDAEDIAYSCSDRLAGELTGLGVAAIGLPRVGGDGWEPGVWLDAATAAQLAATLRGSKP